MIPASERLLWELFRHLKAWLANLQRAGASRKHESIEALRGVVIAARLTQTYLRRLQDKQTRDHAREGELTRTWTELGFRLADLGLNKLAKRCDISGRYWADPKCFDTDFMDKADIGLERMEALARQLIAEVEAS